MAAKRLPLRLKPGLFRAGTVYQSAGRWYDAHLVRFLADTIRPIGGWRRMVSDVGVAITALTGFPRGACAWRTYSGATYLALGTHSKLYVIASGVKTDITPAGFTVGRIDSLIPQQGGAANPSANYGDGNYNAGQYGEGSSVGVRNDADTWQLDTFGDYLVAVCTSDKKLYVWPNSLVTLPTVPAGAPTSAVASVTTPERFLFALGAAGNLRKIQWASQETYTVWTPAATNSAGGFEIATNGALVCGRRTRRETLLFTTTDLWAATYIGGDLIYRFDQVGKQCGIVSPNAVAAFDTEAMWMSYDAFLSYDGFVRTIPCDVHDYVFRDFNRLQAAKVWARTCSQYGEITWHYPSGTAMECDRYVTYNYREKHWTVGKLSRAIGVDAGAMPYPALVTSDGLIYEHEFGDDRGAEVPYLESGPIELGEGDVVMDVLGLVPDEKTLGDVQVTFYSQFEPMDAEVTNGPYSLAMVTDARFSARQVRMRLTQARQTSWRVGTPRLLVTPAGYR